MIMDELTKTNFERLTAIKKLITTTTVTELAQLKTIGGSALFYGQLNRAGVINKQDGIYSWNPKIPATPYLAKTMTDKTRQLFNTSRSTPTPKKTGYKTTNEEKDFFVTDSVKPKGARKAAVKQPIVTNKEFSLFWGLIKYKSIK